MTSKIIFSSNKLGVITDDQLQEMLNKFNLGRLISSRNTEQGVMKQTRFVYSTEGEFVFKGNPLYPGQLIEEKFFVEELYKRTNVNVPIPYFLDDTDDIFGWSYSIMPRLPGEHLNSKRLSSNLNRKDKFNIAGLIAETLLEFHSWKASQYGDLDTKDLTIRPFEESYVSWLYNRIRYWLNDAKKYSRITTEDVEWVEALLENARSTFQALSSPTYVMGDFKPGNFLVSGESNKFHISGVFDFTNTYFGDPISDLIKMITIYIDNDEIEVAKHLLSHYLDGSVEKEDYKQRLQIHMLHQRILDWGCAKAIGMVTWNDDLAFSEWAARYTDTVANLID
ncbi:phosphotransferase family protein [Alkalihalobacillus sp. AL-G]|uniref:phosphotransferase family protein n=1 Tax=Alkalihalobacillus sp. AL-G TaxID=2926399 RepID=UPI00272985E9|nr:aminoglycoside phosphotransferase family protein [Alkalihalobacillus sp. AL-G]WLD94628.1 aminoglycoside phosphotransferase family protein [Alkalihalobacillus sp. AL-G]